MPRESSGEISACDCFVLDAEVRPDGLQFGIGRYRWLVPWRRKWITAADASPNEVRITAPPVAVELSEYPRCGQPGWSHAVAVVGVASPSPFQRICNQRGPDRIQGHITRCGKKLFLFFDHHSMEPALNQMAGELVARVKPLRIHAIQVVHSFGEVRVSGLNEKVEVVRHLAIGVHDEAVALYRFRKSIRPDQIVPVINVDVGATVPT